MDSRRIYLPLANPSLHNIPVQSSHSILTGIRLLGLCLADRRILLAIHPVPPFGRHCRLAPNTGADGDPSVCGWSYRSTTEGPCLNDDPCLCCPAFCCHAFDYQPHSPYQYGVSKCSYFLFSRLSAGQRVARCTLVEGEIAKSVGLD